MSARGRTPRPAFRGQTPLPAFWPVVPACTGNERVPQ